MKLQANTYYVCRFDDLVETDLQKVKHGEIFLYYGSISLHENFIVFGLKQEDWTKIIEIRHDLIGRILNSKSTLLQSFKELREKYKLI